MALCTVRHGRDWMEVCSPTGVQIRVQNPRSVALTGPEESLTYLLMTGASPRAEELSHDQMRVFLTIRQKVQDSIPKEPEPVEEETGEEQEEATEAIPAPVVVSAHKIYETTAQVIHDNVLRRTVPYTMNGHEQRIGALQAVSNKLNQDDFVMLIYDIPDVKGKVCPNPSRLLWRHGFRINLSCWVLPSKQMEKTPIVELLAHWQQHQIKTYVIPQAESQRDEIRKIAREKLEEEIRAAHTSLIERIASADERHREALVAWDIANSEGVQGEASKEDLDRKHANAERALLREAGERLNAAIECAELFDERESVGDLLQGLREAISAEVKARNVTLWIGRGRGKRK